MLHRIGKFLRPNVDIVFWQGAVLLLLLLLLLLLFLLLLFLLLLLLLLTDRSNALAGRCRCGIYCIIVLNAATITAVNTITIQAQIVSACFGRL
jgi:hypothetical protein